MPKPSNKAFSAYDAIEYVMKIVGEDIKKVYSKEAGIDINDPYFWEKIAEYKAIVADDYSQDYEIEYCPHCGQEM